MIMHASEIRMSVERSTVDVTGYPDLAVVIRTRPPR